MNTNYMSRKMFDRWCTSPVSIDDGWKECFRKIAYRYPRQAKDAVKRLAKKGREVEAYQCRVCHMLHVASKK